MSFRIKNVKVSPKDFMKQIKPHRFSDSKIIIESKLNRTLLEYHLDSLTKRKQEKEFEEFARKLCQYEICPNLRPQTGSTGGGDSKVDSEAIPVASQIRISFFQGKDSQTEERIAFAFSTYKDWSGKARHDVKGISETGRSYTKVYFVTSQFARDRTRARLEDELNKEYNIKVVILDRTWILDKVFENKREKLAIKELGLGEGLEERKEVGPLDYQRSKHLIDTNKKIEEDVGNDHITIRTIEDCLNTAILAAELEAPKKEVEGLFDRALRFAKQYGTEVQYFTSLYQKAWITFFWYEDFEIFLDLYEEIEKIALDSNNISFVERLNNLWTLLFTLCSTSELISTDSIKHKTETLTKKLHTFKDNDANSSASIQAEAMLCFMNLVQHRDDQKEVANTFCRLKDILDVANDLIGFPFETTFKLLNALDRYFSGESNYENLQDHLIGIVTQREGDISAGELLLNRGIQHLKVGRIYKAVDCLGRALMRFYKQESKDRLVYALFLLSVAYENAGLLWAARGSLLNASAYATNDFWLYGEVNTMQLACYERLRNVELRLGRIGYALEWHNLYSSLALQLIINEEEKEKLLKDNLYFGSLMGLLLIKTHDRELRRLEKLPDTLLSMDLDFAAFGLIYRLGGYDLLPQSFLDKMTPEEVENFFNSYLSQPAQESLPDKPDYYENSLIELRSQILGCDFVVKTSNSSPEIEIGEYILASLESFLSTAMDMQAISRDSDAILTISGDVTQSARIMYELKKDGKVGASITCGSFNPHALSRESQKEICLSVSDIVLRLVANTIVFKDPKVDLQKLFRDEEVSSRAFNFSTPLVTIGNVLGHNPKRSISQWMDPNSKSYPFSFEKSGRPIKIGESRKDDKSQVENLDEYTRHTRVKNVSVIRQHLWDEAGWGGVLYMVPPSTPPLMGFIFNNADKAKAIFKDWNETFGKEDKDETIRVSMIRGVSKKNPMWYKAVVTTNLDEKNLPKDRDKVIVVSRVHTLTPDTTENLDRFVQSFNIFGIYLIVPAIFDKTKPYPTIFTDLGIVKRSFIERRAWEIGLNDLDFAAITDDIEPIIPKGVKNPPVAELLEYLRKQGK